MNFILSDYVDDVAVVSKVLIVSKAFYYNFLFNSIYAVAVL